MQNKAVIGILKTRLSLKDTLLNLQGEGFSDFLVVMPRVQFPLDIELGGGVKVLEEVDKNPGLCVFLAGLGLSDSEARRHEVLLRQGGFLLSVSTPGSSQRITVAHILETAGAEEVVVTGQLRHEGGRLSYLKNETAAGFPRLHRV